MRDKGATGVLRGSGMLQADIYTPLRTVLDRLWTLWEHVVLAEPLLVIAPSPGLCRPLQDSCKDSGMVA